MASLEHKIHLTIPLPEPRLADIARRVLSVDQELRNDQVQRTLSVEGSNLIAHFDCASARMLRVSVNSFFEMIILVTRTIDAFDGME